MALLKVTKSTLYIKTKINFCRTPPFSGLGKLAMWYSYCIESELNKWESASRSAQMGECRDMGALTIHPQGFTARRIKTDGKLLEVFDDHGVLFADSRLPIAVLGKNIRIVELEEMADFLNGVGGFPCKFAVRGKTYTGTVLEGKFYCAAWTVQNIGVFFETEASRNPNGKILERL